MKKNLFLLCIVFLSVVSLSWGQSTDATTKDASVVVLFRHGETDGSPERHLSNIGKERAELLAKMLKDINPDKIFSTDIYRTKETAEPLRKLTSLNLSFYGLSDMQTVAEEMKTTPGTYIVSGHSNTTPDMVRLLGADPGEPINESEYDRLYVVTITNGKATAVMIRFGNTYVKE